MGQLQERITSTRDGSITSLQAVFVPLPTTTPHYTVAREAQRMLQHSIELQEIIAILGFDEAERYNWTISSRPSPTPMS